MHPRGEPQLGRRGLYRKLGGFQDIADAQLAMLWILNLSDGENDVLDIAERSGMHFQQLHKAACILRDQGLIALSD